MTFELWELRTGNLMATFATEQDALRAAADAALRFGDSYTDHLSLSSVAKNGTVRQVAEGSALLIRARATDSPAPRASA